MNLCWPMDPPTVPEERWLAYHYTKLGRQTYIGQWTPQYQKRDDLHTTTQNSADEPTLANGPSHSTRGEMTCIPLHKTWQMNLCWPMDPPPVPEERWLAYHYTKLGRWTYIGQWTLPQYQRRDDLHTTTQNLADKPTLANGPPQYQKRDDLHTTTQNSADEPMLADGPSHSTRGEMTCIPLHKTWQMNLCWPMDPPAHYQSRDALNTSTQNLADEPTLADRHPSTRGEMTCIPLHKTWQMNLCWPMDPPTVPEKRWLAYHYTKLGRQTYIGQWTPQYQKRDDLHTTTQNLADEPTLAHGPSHSTRGVMTCIPLHKTQQMNLHWLMDPPVPEERWLSYLYTKLGRRTYVGQWTPWYQRRDDLHTTTQNLADEPTLAIGLPQYQKRDYLHTTTQNSADEPILANGPPSTRAEMLWIPVQKFGRWTSFGQWTPLLVPEQRWLAYHYTQFGRWTYFDWTQWQRFDSSSIHHVWAQHFLKTNFSLESGILSFLELQKSLPVSCQGCWTQWQRFKSSSIHHFWDTPQHFLKTHFCLESLSFIPRVPEITTSKFSGVMNTMAKVWKL